MSKTRERINALDLESNAEKISSHKYQIGVQMVPALLTVKQAAFYLGISSSCVRNYIRMRILKRTYLPDPLIKGRFINKVLISRSELDRLVKAGEEI